MKRFIMDYKTQEREIHLTSPFCDICGVGLKNGQGAYFGDYEKRVFCRACVISGRGSDSNIFQWGTVKVVKEDKFKDS